MMYGNLYEKIRAKGVNLMREKEGKLRRKQHPDDEIQRFEDLTDD